MVNNNHNNNEPVLRLLFDFIYVYLIFYECLHFFLSFLCINFVLFLWNMKFLIFLVGPSRTFFFFEFGNFLGTNGELVQNLICLNK